MYEIANLKRRFEQPNVRNFSIFPVRKIKEACILMIPRSGLLGVTSGGLWSRKWPSEANIGQILQGQIVSGNISRANVEAGT
jgi:hypothetical protein